MGLSSSFMLAAGKFERLWIDSQEWGLRKMDRLQTLTGRVPVTPPHLVTGLLGERAAMFELRRRGIVVVARRWTSAKVLGDLDLVGWDGDCLCFVEVKTRTARDMNPAEAEVDEHKRKMVRGLAKAYLQSFPAKERSTIPVRFDVVSVYLIGGAVEFEFFEAAFGWR
jgi:putative endonuclease